MPRTTPIQENCGTCTECAHNPQIIKCKCHKGGFYRLVDGYVGSFDDICKPQIDVLATLITSITIGQIVGFFTMYITNNPPISAAMCFVVSLVIYLCDND